MKRIIPIILSIVIIIIGIGYGIAIESSIKSDKEQTLELEQKIEVVSMNETPTDFIYLINNNGQQYIARIYTITSCGIQLDPQKYYAEVYSEEYSKKIWVWMKDTKAFLLSNSVFITILNRDNN
jgi:hypothetical protein